MLQVSFSSHEFSDGWQSQFSAGNQRLFEDVNLVTTYQRCLFHPSRFHSPGIMLVVHLQLSMKNALWSVLLTFLFLPDIHQKTAAVLRNKQVA
ncbi:hypothetical protein NC651_004685 [Populus alba x Populus x berolinensis]|nr:hypothetical protein NC651_004685 [Populus alba x Populus x berolinensis]